MAGCHDAALFHGVVQQRQGCGGAMGAAALQPQFFQDPRHRIADGGGGRQGQVYDPKGYIQPLAGFPCHQLTHTSDPKSGLFDGLRHHVKGLTLDGLKGVMHYARAGDAHVDDGLRLAHTVERTGHKGVIFHRIAEHHQLGAAKAGLLSGAQGGLFHCLPHEPHGVHVDARSGGTHVDRGADVLGAGQGFRNGGDELPIAIGHALLHQGGVAADEVDAAGLGRPIHGLCKGDVIRGVAGRRHQSHGGDGNALIDDGDAEFQLDLFAGGHQTFGVAADLVIDLSAGFHRIAVAAGEQGDAHGDGTDVQVLLVDHVDGL